MWYLLAMSVSSFKKRSCVVFVLLFQLIAKANGVASRTSSRRCLDYCNNKDETFPCLDFPVSIKDMAFYQRISLNSTLRRSGVEADLFLAYNILHFKSIKILRFSEKDDKFAKLILLNVIEDVRKINKTVVFFREVDDKNVVLDEKDICTLYNIRLKYNIAYIEHLIDRHFLVKSFDLYGNVKNNFINRAFSSYSSIMSLYKDFENRLFGYSGKLECGYKSKRYVQILEDFFLFLLNKDIKNETMLLKYYNKVILKFALNDLASMNLDIIKMYTNYMIELNENILINIIDEICKDYCEWKQVAIISLLIDKLSVGNESVEAFNYLYSLIKGHNYSLTADILYVEKAAEKQWSEPAFKNVKSNLRKEFVNFKYLISNWTKTFIDTFAIYVSNLGGKDEIKYQRIVKAMKATVLDRKDTTVSSVWAIEKLIKLLYNVIPDKVNKILRFISIFYGRKKLYFYGKLLDILSDGGKNFNMEILRVIHYIRAEGLEDAVVYSKMHYDIKLLIWEKACLVKNVAYNDYLFRSNPYFTNRIESNSTKYLNISNLLSSNYNTSSSSNHRTYRWYFKYDHINNTFVIIESTSGSYLSVGKRARNNFRLEFLPKSDERFSTKWKLYIVKLDQKKNKLIFQLSSQNDKPEYLFGARSKLDRDTRSVFMSKKKENTNDSFWTLFCGNSVEKQVEAEYTTPRVSIPVIEKQEIPVKNVDDKTEKFLYETEDVDYVILKFVQKLKNKLIFRTSKSKLNLEMRDVTNGLMNNFLQVSYIQLLELIEFSSYSHRFSEEKEKIYKQNFIESIQGDLFNLLSIQRYLLHNISRQNEESIDYMVFCKEIINYFKIYKDHLEIYSNIFESNASREYLTVYDGENFEMEFNAYVSLSTSIFLDQMNYLEENHPNCLAQLKFKSNDINIGTNVPKTLILHLVPKALLHLKFNTAAIYFALFRNETVIFEIFEGLHVHCLARKNVYNYFVTFIFYLLDTHNLRVDTAAKIVAFSYRTLNASSLLTESLRSLYNTKAELIISNSSSNITDGMTLELRNILMERQTRLIELADMIVKENMNDRELERLGNIVSTYYNEDVPRLVSYIYEQIKKDDIVKLDKFWMFTDFLGETPTKNAFDYTIQLLIKNGKGNNTEAIKFTQLIYKNFGYIPCFHTGCIDDVHLIHPGFVKNYFEGAVCTMFPMRYGRSLFITKTYFVNHVKGKAANTSLTIETNESSFSNYDWIFEYVEEKGVFLMKSRERILYVSLGKRLGRKYKLALVKDKYADNPIEWKVELRKNNYENSRLFTLRPVQFNESLPLYLSVTEFDFKSESGTILLSSLKSRKYANDIKVKGHPEVWAILRN